MEGIDAIATALMFCWAGVVFLLAILFEIQHRRLKSKLEALKKSNIGKYSIECFSISWDADQGRRKIIEARVIHIMIPTIIAFAIGLILFSIFPSLGYAMFVPFIGLPIFLDNALEIYKYSRAVQKVPLEKLQDKDREYIEDAIELLATRPIIYSIIGVIFSITAPFIPQFFNFLPSVIAAYTRPAFFLSEKLGIIGIFVIVLFIALPMALLIEYKWIIRQIMVVKRLIELTRSKLRRNES